MFKKHTALSFLVVATVVTGCSSGSSSSSTSSNVTAHGYVNQQDMENAAVYSGSVAESGTINSDGFNIVTGDPKRTDSSGYASLTVDKNQAVIFEARNVASDGNGFEATTRKCQVVAGCQVSGETKAFGTYFIQPTAYQVRSVVYKPGNKSINNINAITHIAQAFAYQKDVLNKTDNGTFTPYDIELANSQVSTLFDINDIISYRPADLSKLTSVGGSETEKNDAIRYGALLAALQQLELSSATPKDFLPTLSEQFAENVGQLYQKDSDSSQTDGDGQAQILTMEAWLTAAKNNLQAVIQQLGSAGIKANAETVVTGFETQIAALKEDQLTAAVPGDISSIISASEQSEIALGLAQVKAFVKSMKDYRNTFWTDGYEAQITDHAEMIQTFNKDHASNIDAATDQYIQVYKYYLSCISGSCDAQNMWHSSANWNASTKILTVSSKNIEAGQKLVNLTPNSTSDVTSSQAVDVYIKGDFDVTDAGNNKQLKLNIDHSYQSDDTTVNAYSAVRVYYDEKVTDVRNDLTATGYSLVWQDVRAFDPATDGTAQELEFEGNYSATYIGVDDPCVPSCNSLPRRYNLESVSMIMTVADLIEDGSANNKEQSRIAVDAKSSNADTFYPEKEFSSFNGFLKSNASIVAPATIDDLLAYNIGTENVAFGSGSITVDTIDFINKFSDDVRYRFYPEEQVEDQFDADKDGNTTETVTRYKLEECIIEKQSSGDYAVTRCGPKAIAFNKRDMQKSINDLWENGAFRKIQVEGIGNYYVDFPTEKDSNGCEILQDLKTATGFTGQGAVIAHEREVLGLDAVNLSSTVTLYDADGNKLPATLLHANIIADREEDYKVDLALSHNYSGVATDALTGLAIGNRFAGSVFTASYDTRNQLQNQGFFYLYKSGVTLTHEEVEEKTTSVADPYSTLYFQDQLSFNLTGVDFPYKDIVNADGEVDRCVLAKDLSDSNQVGTQQEANQTFYLNYRGTVYGIIRPENGIWVVRYLDGNSDNDSFGSWETLL